MKLEGGSSVATSFYLFTCKQWEGGVQLGGSNLGVFFFKVMSLSVKADRKK